MENVIVLNTLHLIGPSLHGCNTITQTQCNPLCLGTDADVTSQLAVVVFLFLHRNIDQSVFTEHTAS